MTLQIVIGIGNALFHSEWDNLSKIMTNVHGFNVVNSAGEIIIQETTPGYDVTQHEKSLPLYDRSKVRILKVDIPKSLPPLHIYTRVGPKISTALSFTPPSENDEQWISADMPRPTDPVKRVGYADDLTVCASGVNIPDLEVSLNNYLEEITAYLQDNSLLISAPKYSVAPPRHTPTQDPS